MLYHKSRRNFEWMSWVNFGFGKKLNIKKRGKVIEARERKSK